MLQEKRLRLIFAVLILALALVVVSTASAAPLAQDTPPAEDIPFDLSGLQVGSIALSPIIFLLVAALKSIKIGGKPLLAGRDPIIAAVAVLATIGYAFGLLALANPDLMPIFETVLRAGKSLLEIFFGGGAAIGIHKVYRFLTKPSQPPVFLGKG